MLKCLDIYAAIAAKIMPKRIISAAIIMDKIRTAINSLKF